MAMNQLLTVSQDERERAIYLSRKKYRNDMESNMNTVKENGRLEGRLEGRAERDVAIAKSALKMGLNIADIEKLTGLPADEIVRLRG